MHDNLILITDTLIEMTLSPLRIFRQVERTQQCNFIVCRTCYTNSQLHTMRRILISIKKAANKKNRLIFVGRLKKFFAADDCKSSYLNILVFCCSYCCATVSYAHIFRVHNIGAIEHHFCVSVEIISYLQFQEQRK